MRVVLATRNPGKLREMRRILAHLPVELVDLTDTDYADYAAPAETGSTFEENAILKARLAASWTGEISLGEDSGLEVVALGGRPGVLSARYGGEGLSDEDRVRLVLSEMAGVSDRRAQFVCVTAVAVTDGRTWTFQGVVEGILTEQPRGAGGFGYDPIFMLPDRGLTTAEISAEEKDEVSHRGEALRKASAFLAKLLDCEGERA